MLEAGADDEDDEPLLVELEGRVEESEVEEIEVGELPVEAEEEPLLPPAEDEDDELDTEEDEVPVVVEEEEAVEGEGEGEVEGAGADVVEVGEEADVVTVTSSFVAASFDEGEEPDPQPARTIPQRRASRRIG